MYYLVNRNMYYLVDCKMYDMVITRPLSPRRCWVSLPEADYTISN